MAKIYLVQNLDYTFFADLINTTDIDKAEEVLLGHQNNDYVVGSVWENGERIAEDLKSFYQSPSETVKNILSNSRIVGVKHVDGSIAKI